MKRLILVALSITVGLAGAGVAVNQSAMAGGMEMKGGGMAMPHTKGSLRILSPRAGQKITTTDIPVRVAVSHFRLSPEHVGMPDVDGEGHIHVMHDGMNMGVLFNAYASPDFTLPGRGLTPGRHTLIFVLASNTHMAFGNTVRKVTVDYEPTRPEPLPAPEGAGTPMVKIVSPADGATVGPRFTLQVEPTHFTPALDLEGKRNVQGYGHYHVFVDMDMSSMKTGGMMSMAGMVGMPGSNTIPLDLSAWKNGRHTITVMPVQDDHTPIPGAMPATITIHLKDASE